MMYKDASRLDAIAENQVPNLLVTPVSVTIDSFLQLPIVIPKHFTQGISSLLKKIGKKYTPDCAPKPP